MVIEGVNNASSHAAFMCGMRSVDMGTQAVKAAAVHRDDTLKNLADRKLARTLTSSPRSFGRSTDRDALSANSEGASADNEAMTGAMKRVRMEFRRALLMRYHSITSAWRELDPRQHGRLGFYDFCRACRNLGYDSESRLLWEALDADGDGFVSLWDIDPRLAESLYSFSEVLKQKSGSAETAWRQFFNTQGIGRCSGLVFTRACERVGFGGDRDAVYKAMNMDRTTAGVAFEDFLLLDRWFKVCEPGRWRYNSLRPTLPNSQLFFEHS